MTDTAPPTSSTTPSSSSVPGASAEAVPDRQLGKPLTAKQQLAYDLRMQGKKRADAASIMGISQPVYSKTLQVAYKKLGISSRKKGDVNSNATEIKNPEKAAAVIDAITEPAAIKKIKKAYEEAGLPEGVSQALVRRLKVKYYGAITQTRNLKASEIAQLFSEKIDLAARYMDDKTAGEASFRDLALASTAMAEKRQLLRGEPTAIVSDHERAKLHELLPALLEEGRRRGITVDGQVTEKTLEPSRT